MLILAVETSCDETSVALVRDGRSVLSNVVSSQIAVHAPYGGVVPEIASRQHVLAITRVTEEALTLAGVTLEHIDAVAATRGPGLAGSLLVGYSFASALAIGRNVPFAGVNHLHGHLYSVWLSFEESPAAPPPLPMLALIVSGGHTELVFMKEHGVFEVIGRTLDDAAGEAFDKVARLLGLSYPGGPAIQRAALEADAASPFPRAWLPGTDNFSFSGLKTAALHSVRAARAGGPIPHNVPAGSASSATSGDLQPQQVAYFASGFQESVVDVLVTKTLAAARRLSAASVAVVGGVAANAALRERIFAKATLPVFVARPDVSTDNAAMIAAAAYYLPDTWTTSDIDPSLDI